MGGFNAGIVWGFTFGVMFGAVIVGSIWARHFLRTYKEQCRRSDRSEKREERLLAITEVLNEDKIRAREDDIGKTQRMYRSRALAE